MHVCREGGGAQMLRIHSGSPKNYSPLNPVKMPVGNIAKNGNPSRELSHEAKANGDDDYSNSEGETSSYDEEDGERRKGDYLDDMQFLEQQFSDLKELLYQERVLESERKIHLVAEGDAPEYRQPLRELESTLQERTAMAELQYKCRTTNVENKYAEEVQAAHQDFKEMCHVILMRMKNEVQEKAVRMQEEKIMADLTAESPSRKRKAKVSEFLLPEKRKKPVTVTGPCVVYMLRDMDIMEDLTDIRKGRATLEVQRRNMDQAHFSSR